MTEIKIDRLIRSHRKTIGLMITQDARLIVRAPFFATADLIHLLIERKKSWITAKQDYFKQRQAGALVRNFVAGEQFLFLGQNYPLVVAEDIPKAVVFDHSLMISSMVLGNAKDHLECWYKDQALEYITRKAQYYAHVTGFKYRSIRINSAKTRWGSCGHKNVLNFTWRLIMAPSRVVDYVIIHELVHLKQRDHSRQFWEKVGQIIPDYKKDEKWLKMNGHLLAWE
ncbi:MAG: M48 family metallopeptidase [Candidatus Omnitrophica bacterium]|nr:M48 family metallopeptidase [Candidatus Omnitrophota bacterium]